MLPRSIVPATAVAVLVFSDPASAAGAGPSATPLILELVLAAVVLIGLAIRGPVTRLLGATRRRLSFAARRRAAAVPARDA